MPIQLSNEAKVNPVICAAISWNHSNTSLIQSIPSITQGTNIYQASTQYRYKAHHCAEEKTRDVIITIK